MGVSVVIPNYNGEKYLKKCLDSLINQTLKEIEIIVVSVVKNIHLIIYLIQKRIYLNVIVVA